MKQFNKIDCQESSAEKHRSFEHNGIYRDTWLGKDGTLSSERKWLCWAKNKWKPVCHSPEKYAKLKVEDSVNFLSTNECLKYLFHYCNRKNDI